jgi:hypothetical protein
MLFTEQWITFLAVIVEASLFFSFSCMGIKIANRLDAEMMHGQNRRFSVVWHYNIHSWPSGFKFFYFTVWGCSRCCEVVDMAFNSYLTSVS